MTAIVGNNFGSSNFNHFGIEQRESFPSNKHTSAKLIVIFQIIRNRFDKTTRTLENKFWSEFNAFGSECGVEKMPNKNDLNV